MEGDSKGDTNMGSPSNSQQTISDDDEIDYSLSCLFYHSLALIVKAFSIDDAWNVVLGCSMWLCESLRT
ncbi:hypothetical protein OIU79_018127 [Salix purpurea]|uniref:Uncharacterized protein n=1 Tax=Salix purpurea TaxID=77065 RepID=A0A9Q0WX80_SALPP|nr:hypothetical protein OIU79_018127 [Salix purpurea]